MKNFRNLLSSSLLFVFVICSYGSSDRKNETVVLSGQAVQNLGIKTIEVEERPFEKTLFAIGRIEEIPASRSVLSTRIAGRVVALNAFEGDIVEEGQSLLVVESRQLGNPPPRIELKALQGGVVVSSHVRLGQPVSPDAELMDITDQSHFWAVAKIPEQEASALRIGIDARIHIPALGNTELTAKLSRFGVNANREAGTVEGIFVVENSGQKLRPGMRAEFSIVLETRPNVLSVPKEAIQGDPINRMLFVEDFELENAFVRSSVVIGEKNDKHVEIVSGLFPGDKVVTEGSYALSFSSGSSDGLSLKEALDIAHGHEHNEDGSEITEEDRRKKSEEKKRASGQFIEDESKSSSPWLKVYALVVTVLFLVSVQVLLKRKKTGGNR